MPTAAVTYRTCTMTMQDNPLDVAKRVVEEYQEHNIATLIISTPYHDESYKVYADMVGDLFHAGHANMCRQAVLKGQEKSVANVILIAGICSDEECAPYKRQPILNLAERAAAAVSCRFVSAVLCPAPLVVTEEALDYCGVDMVVHGDDFSEEKTRKYYGVPIDRGIYSTVPYTQGLSTSEIIARCNKIGDDSLA